MTGSAPQATPRQVLTFVAVAGVAGVLLFHGCSGGSGKAGSAGKSKPGGCVFLDDARQPMADLEDGLKAHTLTLTDMAALFKKVHDALDDTATSSTGEMEQDARAGSDDAGRARVALLEGDDASTVSDDVGDLTDRLRALDVDCG